MLQPSPVCDACVSALQFDGILRSYFAHVLDAPQMRRKFDTVRMRGRKRLAFG